MAPPRVAENARAREWTQGTSGVGHGENVNGDFGNPRWSRVVRNMYAA